MKKNVFLTIDDSPSKDFLPKLNFLKKQKIPAVFFCIGNLLESREAMAIECIRSGYTVANHSYSHPHFSEISVEQCIDEITKTDLIIEQLYQQAGVTRAEKWFRFPYGDKGDKRFGKVFSLFKKGDQKRKDAIQNCLRELGYTQPNFEQVTYRFMDKSGLYKDIDWSWTFDIMEWAMLEKKPTLGLKTLDKVITRFQKKNPKDCRGFLGFEKRWLASNSDEVLLLHDHEGTTVHFEEIILELLKLPLDFSDFTFSAES